jgi:hypothetical protein
MLCPGSYSWQGGFQKQSTGAGIQASRAVLAVRGFTEAMRKRAHELWVVLRSDGNSIAQCMWKVGHALLTSKGVMLRPSWKLVKIRRSR